MADSQLDNYPEDNPETASWFVRLETEIDSLSGLTNRYAGIEKLERLLNRAKKDRNVAVVFIDLDRFKPINNKYGHKYGDDILRECASGVQSVIRPGDILFRYGGDEIVWVLTNYKKGDKTEEENRIEIEERLITGIQNRLSLRSDAPSHPELRDIGATVGIASYEDGDTAESIINRADVTQYGIKRQKQQGGYSNKKVLGNV